MSSSPRTTTADFSGSMGSGKKAIENLREELTARGLSFADEDPS